MSHADTAFKAVKSTLNINTLVKHVSDTRLKRVQDPAGDFTYLMAAILRKVTLAVPGDADSHLAHMCIHPCHLLSTIYHLFRFPGTCPNF